MDPCVIPRTPAPEGGSPRVRWIIQVAAPAAVLMAVNLHTVLGWPIPEHLVFSATAVSEGEWWRVVTYPLVHVSLWHLLLDGAAFLFLVEALRPLSGRRVVLWTVVSAAGALLVPLLLDSGIRDRGLCGLSGASHGLTAVWGLELMRTAGRDRALRALGAVVLGAVWVKSGVEALRGEVLFASLHLGPVGLPIASTHAGGVAGGTLSFLLWMVSRRRRARRPPARTAVGVTVPTRDGVRVVSARR